MRGREGEKKRDREKDSATPLSCRGKTDLACVCARYVLPLHIRHPREKEHLSRCTGLSSRRGIPSNEIPARRKRVSGEKKEEELSALDGDVDDGVGEAASAIVESDQS